MTDSTDNARVPERVFYQEGFMEAFVEVLPDARKNIPATEYIRADLAPDPLRAVKVRALDWEEPEFLGANPSHAPHTSSTTMGLYFANEHAFWYEGGPANSADNLEAAKSAAQADYEARIRSALEPDPLADARVKVLVEAVNEAVCLLWEEMSKQGNVGTHGGYIYMKLRPALAAFDKGGKDE